MDAEKWILRAKQGDADAFNRLVDMFQQTAFNVAMRYTNGHVDDAMDACQEAMLSAWQALPRFEGDARGFRAWLIRIVVNACRDRYRYEARRPTAPIEVDDGDDTWKRPLPDPGQSPQAYAENADLESLLMWALEQLSEDHRSVVVLDQAGFDYAQMAEILGVEVGTIKSRLSRARQNLRTILTEREAEDREREPKRRHPRYEGRDTSPSSHPSSLQGPVNE